MLKNIELVIFDMDGVLVNSLDLVLLCYKKSLEKIGYNYPYEKIRKVIGGPPLGVLSKLIPKTEVKRDEKIRIAKREYDKIGIAKDALKKVKLLPYAKEIVKELKDGGYKLAMITNQDRKIASAMLKKFSLKGYWNYIIFADDGFETKIDAILFLMSKFVITPEKTAYVGDMVKDAEIAKKVGCMSISIPGWNDEKQLKKAKPDYLIRSLQELSLHTKS